MFKRKKNVRKDVYKRQVLNDTIEKSELDPRIKTLKILCATHWVAKFNAVRDFMHKMCIRDRCINVCGRGEKPQGECNGWLDSALMGTCLCSRMHMIQYYFSCTCVWVHMHRDSQDFFTMLNWKCSVSKNFLNMIFKKIKFTLITMIM